MLHPPGPDNRHRPIRALIGTVLAVASLACGGEDPPVPATIAISPSNTSVSLDDSVQLVAAIRDGRGAVYPGTVSWSSRDLEVASVSATGMVRALDPGSTTVVATFQSITGEAAVVVTDDDPPTVSLLAPDEGETLSGVTPVTVDASDNDGVASIELLVDGVSRGEVREPPWELFWDTRDVSNGERLIRVIASDPSGNESSSFSRPVVVANPPVALDDWAALAPLPVPVRSAAVAADGSKVYVAGGTGASGRTDVLQILDLASGTWSFGASLPEPVDWATAVWAEDGLHLMGGVTSTASASTQHLVYDEVAESWQTSVPLPVARAGAASAVHGSRVYVFAGNSGGSPAYTATTLVFDVDLGSWSSGAAVPEARINWSGTSAGDTVHLVGGGTAGLSTSASLYAYDPVADSWTSLPPISQAREAHGTAAIAGLVCGIGGRLAATGNFSAPFDDVSCYDPVAGAWYPAPPLPRALQELSAVSLGDAIIAVGGADAGATPVGDVSIMRVGS